MRLLYERGAFGDEETTIVAHALAAFVIGLTFNGTMLMLNRAFFSLQNAWIPTAVALGNLILNVVLDAALFRVGIWGIPLATSIVNIAGTVALLVLLRRRLGRLQGRQTIDAYLRTAVAAALAAGVAYGTWYGLDQWLGRSLGAQIALGRTGRHARGRSVPGCGPYPSYPGARCAAFPAAPLSTLCMSLDRIRNFSIVAHIDHGKSTLADRILEVTDTLTAREMRDQVLDTMDLERERGITIKAQAVRVEWKGHQLNLIDTPGHVDFTYEVSRALQACEGALLVVDAAQGIEAQTLANAYLAIENNLEIVPVVNKIDLPQADPDATAAEVAELVGEDPERVLRISAKTGEGVEAVLDAIVERIPAPGGDPEAPARALVFDSSYDQYRGVVAFVRMVDGSFRPRERLRAMAQGTRFEPEELGFFSPDRVPTASLEAGEVGYVMTGLKDVSRLRVGDTLTSEERPADEALPGYKDVKPTVFAGLFPTNPTIIRSFATRSRG